MQVATTIADLAGNSIGKAFDVKMQEGLPRGLAAKTVALPFEIE